MRRRALLAAAAPLFAGCGADRSPSPSATRPDTPTPSDHPTATAPEEPPHYEPTGRRYVTLQGSPFERIGVDTLPDPVPFAGDVTLLAQPAGGDAGSLRIGLAHGGDRPLQVRVNHQRLPFVPTAADGGTLAVSHIDTWETDDDCPRGDIGVLPATSKWVAEPGETIEGDREVFAVHGRDVCFPSGSYRFTNGYAVERPREGDAELASFTWGFTLEVGSPE
ncbi:hypothetical protein BRC85_10630 [Halobacteriales archaeon QS_1_69_70]|nr:MAG: hypothetical protein BRC85_10630 [Halobacteriales archaeon QS_1_69_70]